jgi:hypothetical protein
MGVHSIRGLLHGSRPPKIRFASSHSIGAIATNASACFTNRTQLSLSDEVGAGPIVFPAEMRVDAANIQLFLHFTAA